MFRNLLQNIKLAYEADKFFVICTIVGNIVTSMLDLVSIYASAQLLDAAVNYFNRSDANLVNRLWFLFGVIVARWIFANITLQFLDYVNTAHKTKIMDYIDNKITDKLSRLPTEVIEDSSFQDEMTNIQIFSKQRVHESISLIATIINQFVSFSYSLIILAFNNPYVALLIIGISLPEVRYNLYMIKRFKELNEDLTIEQRRKNYFIGLTQDINLFFQLISYDLFPYFSKKIQKIQKHIFMKTKSLHIHHKSRGIAIGTLANLLGQFLPKGFYLLELINRRITLGSFQFYFVLIDQLYNSTFHFYASLLKINENNIYTEKLFNFFNRADAKLPEESIAIDLSEIGIEFRNVSFLYPGSTRVVLKNVSFVVKPFENIAIVGPNGAGKSTILKLINKFYEPTEGQILVNGVDIKNVNTSLWRRSISTLSQDVPRFFLTLEENVSIGDIEHELEQERLNQAVESSLLKNDVENLPKKEKTMLGKYFPEGINLSGGQWQKVGIARSIYRNAKLLILDEPTSAIDSATEQELFNKIFNKKSRTQIVVSHKFSNIKKADQIIVLQDGEIVEHGDHLDLMKRKGLYEKLYSIQSEAFRD